MSRFLFIGKLDYVHNINFGILCRLCLTCTCKETTSGYFDNLKKWQNLYCTSFREFHHEYIKENILVLYI